jgi:hypothetical protein
VCLTIVNCLDCITNRSGLQLCQQLCWTRLNPFTSNTRKLLPSHGSGMCARSMSYRCREDLTCLLVRISEHEGFVLLGYDAASLGNRIATFRSSVVFSSSVDEMSYNVFSKELRLFREIRALYCLETSRSDYPLVQCHAPDERNPRQPFCENVKPRIYEDTTFSAFASKHNLLLKLYYYYYYYLPLTLWAHFRARLSLSLLPPAAPFLVYYFYIM